MPSARSNPGGLVDPLRAEFQQPARGAVQLPEGRDRRQGGPDFDYRRSEVGAAPLSAPTLGNAALATCWLQGNAGAIP